jgi:hypothetical protein
VTSVEHRPDVAPVFDLPRLRSDPAGDHQMLLDSTWWPGPDDLGTKLRALLPALDQVRGPVARLLLSAAGWTTRPHQLVLADRTVSLGYLSDQPPSMITVRCVDGSTFIMRPAPDWRGYGCPS